MQTQIKSVLRPLKVITVEATTAKNTLDCFTDEKWYNYRDGALDANLPKVQSLQSESEFTVLELIEIATFKEMGENILGVSGDIKTLSKLLKERGYITLNYEIQQVPKIETSASTRSRLRFSVFYNLETKRHE